jgi:hypothetical protein
VNAYRENVVGTEMKFATVSGWLLGVGALCAMLGTQYASDKRQKEALRKADAALDLVQQIADRPTSLHIDAVSPQGATAPEIRALIREELRAAASNQPPPSEPSRQSEGSTDHSAPTPASVAALAQATDVVESAIESGTWNESSRSDFEHARTELSADQAEAVARRLSKAINDRQVKVAFTGPLF